MSMRASLARCRAVCSAVVVVLLAWVAVLPAQAAGNGGGYHPTPTPSTMEPKASKTLLLGVTRADGHYVAVGVRGIILRSANGKDWKQVQAPADSPLTSVGFAPGTGDGWAVGHDGTILHTSDGGKTWKLQRWVWGKQQTFLDVLPLSRQRVLAVGSYGLMLESKDGGQSWKRVQVVPKNALNQANLNNILRLGNGDLFIAAEFGQVYRSTDNGDHWTQIKTPYQGTLFGILNPTGQTLVAFGLRGHVFRSDDEGKHWRQIDTPTEKSLYCGTLMGNGRIALGGQNGTVLVSDPGTLTKFEKYALPSGQTVSALYPLKGGGVLALDSNGTHVITAADLKPANLSQ